MPIKKQLLVPLTILTFSNFHDLKVYLSYCFELHFICLISFI